MSDTESANQPPDSGPPSEAARAAIAEEIVLNAAMAFAGHAVAGAQQAAEKASENVPEHLQGVIVRQFWLETATLCLRRLGESYAQAAGDAAQNANVELLRDGAKRTDEARASVEAIGDLGLDLLDRLMAE